jgi:hypothetical protein
VARLWWYQRYLQQSNIVVVVVSELQYFRLYAVREFGLRPVTCLFFFFFWSSILCCVMSRREQVAWCWFLVILYQMDCLFVLYYIIFSCLTSLSLYVLSTVLVSLQVWPVCLDPVSLTLSVSDDPIEPALFLVPFLEIPTSTWEACSIASTSRCLPSPPSCQVAMYVLKNGSDFTEI